MAKYGRVRNGWELKEGNYKASAIWNWITSTKASFMKNIRYQVGSGEKIQFWLYVWVGNTPLANLSPDLFQRVFLELFRCVLDKEA